MAWMVAVVAFLGTGFVIIKVVEYLVAPQHFSWSVHPIERIGSLFLCFMAASIVYNLIKADKPKVGSKEGQGIKSDERGQ